MKRPDSCPHCGASTTAHTGSYCHKCGEDLFPRRGTGICQQVREREGLPAARRVLPMADYTLLIRTDPDIHPVEMIAEILSHLKGVEVVEILEGHGAAPGDPYQEPVEKQEIRP